MADPVEVEVFLNGEARRVPTGASLADVLRAAGAPAEGVAIEVNLAIVRRADLPARRVAAGDRIEVVGFVGGG
jgi:sulfur carrier protein